MKPLSKVPAFAGALFAAAVGDASAACMVNAVDNPVLDKTESQIFENASSLTTVDLLRRYGAPVAIKGLSDVQQQLTWALASGELQVTADRATGKIKDVRLLTSKTPVTESLLSCK